jgi:ABC-2 type transport system permease protein
MIWQIVKKQALLLWRNPQQLFLLVGLPIILIGILGTALGSMMNGKSPEIEVKVALIQHDSEEEQVQQFFKELEKTDLAPEAKAQMQQNISQMSPVALLRESVFEHDEVKKFLTVTNGELKDKEKFLKDDSYTAVIEVPEQFTYKTLQTMVFNEGTQPEIKVFQNEGSQIGASMVMSLLSQFQESLTLQTFLGQKGIEPQTILNVDKAFGEVEAVNEKKPINSKSYYTVGMAAMNVLFVASAISSVAYQEKKLQVFDRVILANVSRWVYFTGVLVTGILFSFLQLLIIFGFSWLVFGVQWSDMISFLLVTLAFSFAVGGIAVLLTAINYRLNSEIISNFFSSFVIALMAFLGGSFYPMGDFSNFFQQVGNFTPNGAGMSAYLTMLRGNPSSAFTHHILFLLLFAVAAIVMAVFSFPKRGRAA